MFAHKYTDIITIENILATWGHFVCGKRKKRDVRTFQLLLADNLITLYKELTEKTYEHGNYSAFNISDPKPRNIHKALVRDRVIHHLIYKELYWYFHERLIFDSYSCRKYKGTHKALDRFELFAGKVSKNHTRTCYVLKCDIKKFFASIDQKSLMQVLDRHIEDEDIKWLINQVLKSFHTTDVGVGLPLGNLSSQLLVNIYMHEFDMYVKQELRVKYYIRYADDFVFLSDDKKYLEDLLPKIRLFLQDKLHLSLHPNKVFIQTSSLGVDFLGWIHFPHHRIIRTTTKRKIIKNTKWYPRHETVNSYRGLLGHGNTHELQEKIGIIKHA
ncbi:MAG: reverse transcriptase/maturase family protein [Minisyncoccia bacterium]